MYFNKFPVLQYPIYNGTTVTPIVARNLLRRVALSDNVREGNGIFILYDVKDGERPEHIAERLYGDPMLHWLVLLMNTVIDPYHGWYKSAATMEEYIQKKYTGYSVFFTGLSGGLLYDSDIIPGVTLTQAGTSTTIEDFEPMMCKLIVQSTQFSTGNAYIEVPGATLGINIRKIEQTYIAAHHFKVDRPTDDVGANETIIVDSLSISNGYYHNVLDGTTDFGASIGATASNFYDTYIGKYMGISGDAVTAYAVSNLIYEMDLNETKRTIKLLHPKYKDRAIRELDNLLKV